MRATPPSRKSESTVFSTSSQLLKLRVCCLGPFYGAILGDLALSTKAAPLSSSPLLPPKPRPNDHYCCMTHTSPLPSFLPFQPICCAFLHSIYYTHVSPRIPRAALLLFHFLGHHRSDSINFLLSLSTHLFPAVPWERATRRVVRAGYIALIYYPIAHRPHSNSRAPSSLPFFFFCFGIWPCLSVVVSCDLFAALCVSLG